MQLNTINPSSVASSVWNNATRNLTGFGSGALVMTASLNGSIAAGATLTLSTIASTFQISNIAVKLGAVTTQTNFNLSDGTNTYLLQIASTANKDYSQIYYLQGTSVQGKVNNTDGALSVTYCFVSLRYVQ